MSSSLLLQLIWFSGLLLLQVALLLVILPTTVSMSSTLNYSLLNAWQWSSTDNGKDELYVNSAFYSKMNNALILTGNNNPLRSLKKRKSSDCFLAQITVDQGLLEWSRLYRTNYNDACSASTPASTTPTDMNHINGSTNSIYAFGFTSSQSFTSSINSTSTALLSGFGFLATPLLDPPVTNLSLSLGLATSSSSSTDEPLFMLHSNVTTTAMPRTSTINTTTTTTSSSPRPGIVLDTFPVNYPIVADTFQNGDILVASLVSNFNDITSNIQTLDSSMTDLPLGKQFKILLQRLSAKTFRKQWTRVLSTTQDYYLYSAFISDLRIAIQPNGQEIIIAAGTTAGYGEGLGSTSSNTTTTTSTLQDDYDGFVTKLYGDTGALVPQGSKRIGSNLLGSEDRISGVCVHPPSLNSSGYIYIIGTTNGSFRSNTTEMTNPMTTTTTTTTTTQHSAFIQQLDFQTMKTLWVRQISPSNNNTTNLNQQMQQTDASGVGCVVSPDGTTVFASGIISNGGSLPNQTSFGGDDIWIASYKMDGSPNFLLQIGSDKQDSLAKHNSILIDSDGRLLLIGTTLGDLTLTNSNDSGFSTTTNRTVSKAFVLQYGEQPATESTTPSAINITSMEDEDAASATFVLLTMPPSPVPLITVQGDGTFSAIRSNTNNNDNIDAITASPIQTNKENSRISTSGVAALVAVILVASFVGVLTLRKIWKKREHQTRMTQRKEDEIIMYHGDDLAPRRSSSYNFGTIHPENDIPNEELNQYCDNEPNGNTLFPQKPNDFSIMSEVAATSTTPDEQNESTYDLNHDTFTICRSSSSTRLGFL